ncbi:STAS domain-containing protein [Cellulomonas xiejunii]|uniref:STAS domain-containing protein n=1 Tax=Cellulomonas xiejunii TaxID=2968083 RepID=UPI001D0E6A3C|nr:STAS domain-containing protein [Cellulomonas xiejunii]MCC2313927.1 STAS domain-containing protein [Cellulomonas xiejunii]
MSSTGLLVRLRGEIDVSLRDEAARALAQVRDAREPVTLDLAQVRLLGAPGLALLVQCEEACSQRGLPCVLQNVPPQAARVLAALELADLLRGAEARKSVLS